MPQILLVNPRKRRAAAPPRGKTRKTTRRKTVRKKRRTAAQKRATAKMVAANRRRKNPVRAKRRSTRKKPTRKRAVTRSRAPVKRRRRRSVARRSNPALNMRSIQNQLMDAGTGAVGALGLDVIQGYLPIPANLKGGIVGTGVKALLAIGMGVAASKIKIVKSSTAAKMANGALIVVLHDELRKQVGNFAPGLQLGEYLDENSLGYYGSGLTAGVMGEGYGGMGTYLPELDSDPMGMEQAGLGMYEDSEPDYIQDMTYS